MDDLQKYFIQYAIRIASAPTPQSREDELSKILHEFDAEIEGRPKVVQDNLKKKFLRELRKALIEHGFSFEGFGLEERGGLEWLTKSTTVGNEEVIALMKMVARGPGK
ncbi:hypothetical protein [Pantoea sp. S62]|uniref:hypothetical protein n=1 Tax=Pantoea sp. S62 TaxID=2769342 RepID=UPI00191263DC|nr:hypothetical protein [Pantoea sp. S62]MBK5017285.1 hypothetical protein [Pantoea sp. S62]